MYDTCTSRYLKLLQSGHLDELTPESLYNLIYDSFDTSILKTRVRNEYYTFSITTTLLGLSQTDLSNSQITSRTIKDALTQSLLDQYSTRPSVDAKDPDVPFFVTIKGDGSIGIYVSLISKNSNHVLRGYRGEKLARSECEELSLLAGNVLIFRSSFSGAKWQQSMYRCH